MGSWDKEIDLGFRGWTLVAGGAGLMVLAWVVLIGTRVRKEPSRCRAELQQVGARCCAPGQGISAGQCVGPAESCPSGFLRVTGEAPGCVIQNQKIMIPAGSVILGPTDWDSVDVVEKKKVSVRAFLIDSSEVTAHRYESCVEAGMCQVQPEQSEPGLPVTGISAKDAADFCAHQGGRLPTPAEWIFAAAGPEARRYPWGPHGLVCRRAAFGLSEGPCSSKGIQPDLSGTRPAGKTPSGILDLAGNVAEWARTEDGKVSVHGGSFRSKTAGELKVWSSRPARRADDVGFRCAYPVREPLSDAETLD